MNPHHTLTRWLERAPPWLFASYAGVMAFGIYFAMYAFRKPFAVADFDHRLFAGVDYKIALVIAQVLGYALSKLIGVKVVAELPAHRRVLGIAAQISLAEAALVAFALIPPPWNVGCLFVNGLALGMVWGMVFAFVEGRRQSEMIAAILCASFILSSGVVKAVGKWVLLQGSGAFAMPAITGALFVPLLLICVYGLSAIPPPSPPDIAERVARVPMAAPARKRLLREYAPGFAGLIVLYILLTCLRDFRDNFAAEIWTETGLGNRAEIFAWTELPISIGVLAALGALTLFRDNRAALAANFALMATGLLLAGAASLAFAAHWVGPIGWMMMLGAGLYLGYTPFNGILFDRLVAANGRPGNAGFLIYVADAFGYGGTVVVLVTRNFVGLHLNFTNFLLALSLVTSAGGLVLLALAARYFRRRLAP